MKKIIKKVLIVLVVLVLVVGGSGFLFIRSMLYPKAMVTGQGSEKIIFVGDSITFGQGVMKNRSTESYPAMVAELLGEEYQTVNYGLCNRTLLSTGNMPYTEEDFAAESLESGAQTVVIMLGTNDSKPDNWDASLYEKEYIELVEKYKSMDSNPKVYVMLPPVIYKAPENSGDCNNEVLADEVIPAIKRVAEATGVNVIDLYSVTEGHEDWYSDGLHPNAEGNTAIAKEICKVLSFK